MSLCPPICTLYLVRRITHWSWNHQIFSKYASLDILGCYWKWASLTLTFNVILAILTQNSKKFGLSAWQLVMDLSYNHRICTKYAFWDVLSWYWKWGDWPRKPWPSRSLGHFNSELHKTAFNAALIYWFTPAMGYFTSQLAIVDLCEKTASFHEIGFIDPQPTGYHFYFQLDNFYCANWYAHFDPAGSCYS